MSYKTRAHQVRAFERAVRKGKMSLREALRSAAMVGACGERDRTLSIVRADYTGNATELLLLIQDVPVMEVLGFETKGRRV